MTLREQWMLRECIRELLAEDGEGSMGGFMGGGPADMGYGMHFGSGEDLYKIFVQPFVDVGQTVAGKGKELSQNVQTLLHTAFETVATTLIPVLSSDYKQIFAAEKQRIDKIRGEYADVYKRTWDAFDNHDLLVASFMYDPSRFLTQKFIEQSPKVAAKLMSVLTGGTIDPELNGIIGSVKSGKHEGAIREDGEQPAPDPKRQALVQGLLNPELLKQVSSSQRVQEMEREGKAMVQDTLKQVWQHAQKVMRAKSVQDLQHMVKKPIPGLDKLKQVPEQERQQGEQQLISNTKAAMKSFYIKSLEAQAKAAVDAGTPSDHPYVKAYQSVIGKIKAM